MGTREEQIFRAELADRMERYDDMTEFMKEVAGMGSPLSMDERTLLSKAFKNSVAARRTACRSLGAQLSQMEGSPVQASAAEYLKKVQTELIDKCNEIISILDKFLIPQAPETEAQVFYLKMKGDYYRYLAETTSGPDRDGMVQGAHQSYEQATAAATSLGPEDPVRLGLALNFSVFYFEVFNQPGEACKLAKAALDDALAVIGWGTGQPGEPYEDSLGVMSLLKDNLSFWDSGGEVDGTAVEEM